MTVTSAWRNIAVGGGEITYAGFGPNDPGLIPVATFDDGDYDLLRNCRCFLVDVGVDAAIALDMPSIRDQVIARYYQDKVAGRPCVPLVVAPYADDFPNRQARRRAKHRR